MTTEMLRWICEGFLTVTACTTSSPRKISIPLRYFVCCGSPIWTARADKRHFSQSLTVLMEGGLKVFKNVIQFGRFWRGECFGAKHFDPIFQSLRHCRGTA